MHHEAFEAVHQMFTDLREDKTNWNWERPGGISALDIGGRNINGSVHDLLPTANWTTLDVVADDGVDVVADARTWRSDERYDLIIATEVFEHVENWPKIVYTMWHHLNPDGAVVITAASSGRRPHGAAGALWPEEGEYYANVEPRALDDVIWLFFNAYQSIYNPNPGDVYALAFDPQPVDKLEEAARRL